MDEVERISVELPTPMADQIRAAVEAGQYASTSEAVRDAIRLWSGRRLVDEQSLDQLRHAWDEGKASGTHGPLDFAELRRDARGRLAAARADAG